MADTGDAQKSEVHATTGDAESSPVGRGDADMTRRVGKTPGHDATPKLNPEPPSPGTTIVRDDTSIGGPLVIVSDDPDLNPPRVPQDPFPTERKPEIDPPVER